nr:hypothetical protein [Tanacetum cinerariifolium]
SDDGNDDDNDETVKAGSERGEDDDDNDEEEEIAKIDKPEDTESDEDDDEATKSDRESKDEETSEHEEESFDPIPRTPEEKEEADELYRDVDVNQRRGLQVTQNIEGSHVTLTPVHSDGLQESSSVSSFVTSMLNPISDAGVESIFTTASSPIQMTEAVQEAVQIQTDQLQDSFQRENDEFLRNIDENIKKIVKGQALVEAYDADKAILDTYGESTILKRRREDDDQEGPSTRSDRGSKRRRKGGEHASASTPSETATG